MSTSSHPALCAVTLGGCKCLIFERTQDTGELGWTVMTGGDQYFIGWVCKDLSGTTVVKYFKFDQILNFIISASSRLSNVEDLYDQSVTE